MLLFNENLFLKVKRKQKEKEFPSFSAMLNPLKPVTQFIPADGNVYFTL